MKKLSILGLALLFASTSPAFAANTCTAPIAPKLPKNGVALNHDQLNAAFAKVQNFDKQNKMYKICLDEVITHPSKVSREQWRAAMLAYNQAAPEGEAVAASYKKLSEDWIEANQAKKP